MGMIHQLLINFESELDAELMFDLSLQVGDIENAFIFAKIKSNKDIQKIIDKHRFFENIKDGWIHVNTTPTMLGNGYRPKGINYAEQ